MHEQKQQKCVVAFIHRTHWLIKVGMGLQSQSPIGINRSLPSSVMEGLMAKHPVGQIEGT